MKLTWFLSVYLTLIIVGGQCLVVNGEPVISSTLECARNYKRIDKTVQCKFKLSNNGDDVIFVSKWFTPLEGIETPCLDVTRNGEDVDYDGILISREFPPPQESYVRVDARKSVSVNIDLSHSYPIEEPGKYTVSVDVDSLFYFYEKSKTNHTISLTSNEVSFTVTQKPLIFRKTAGTIHRMHANNNLKNFPRSDNTGRPLDPEFQGTGATKERKDLLTEIHRATYLYVKDSALEVMENQIHFKEWFGNNLTNRNIVRDKYNKIAKVMETTAIIYTVFPARCHSGLYGYTYHNSRNIYLCPLTFKCKALAPDNQLNSIMSVIIHELSHAITTTEDHGYGVKNSKDLAINSPEKAIMNAENFLCFTQTTYPFNFGINAMLSLNDYVYILKDNIYSRLGKKGQDPFPMDSDYPALLYGNWGDLQGDFKNGFDSIFKCAANSKYTYATKGPNYIRYSDGNASTVDSHYPRKIRNNFGKIDDNFSSGFDSASHLQNGATYVTKGGRYIKYKDPQCFKPIKKSTPIAGYWGLIPADFNQGFDSMVSCATSGKTYITKGIRYVRYSDASASTVDSGYPKNIRGNFGTIKY